MKKIKGSRRSTSRSRSRRGSIRSENSESLLKSTGRGSKRSGVKSKFSKRQTHINVDRKDIIRKRYINQTTKEVFQNIRAQRKEKFKFKMNSKIAVVTLLTLMDYFSASKFNSDNLIFYKDF